MLGLKDRKKEYYFFYVEIKSPQQKSEYELEDDFVKLMKQMKLSINKQLWRAFPNPCSYGLLCEGNTRIKYYNGNAVVV